MNRVVNVVVDCFFLDTLAYTESAEKVRCFHKELSSGIKCYIFILCADCVINRVLVFVQEAIFCLR
jgi:hypothetical protein